MKFNNKGFAITSIIYSMLILFLTLVVLIIGNLASRKVIFDKQKNDILDKFSQYESATFENGAIVYFDVTKGKKCNDYHEDNSKNGYNGISYTKTTSNQNGCLKFYVFNDYEGSSKLNLLLDHNTTKTVNWADSGSNKEGPVTLLAQLKNDTDSWVGTERPSDYTDTLINKTINYEGYKARLITEEDVYDITDNPNIYFFSETGQATETCGFEDISGCLFGWLRDGMVDGVVGYWTANANNEAVVNEVEFARLIKIDTFNLNGVSETSYMGEPVGGGRVQHYGLRPVIEVLRNKITSK